MEPLNYCRSLKKSIDDYFKKVSFDVKNPGHNHILEVQELCGRAQKFMLPTGGRLFDDLEYKALDETQDLKLPFPLIALEYYVPPQKNAENEVIGIDPQGKPVLCGETTVQSSKRIVFAQEYPHGIKITIACWNDKAGNWAFIPPAAIPIRHYLDRSVVIDGRVGNVIIASDESYPISDYLDEVGALLCFLNAIQCSNVAIERSEPRKAAKAKKRSAIPFDSYRYLVVDLPGSTNNSSTTGLGRSPREHLRRGHIHTYHTLRGPIKKWINATVVNAGIGSKVSKDYVMRSKERAMNDIARLNHAHK